MAREAQLLRRFDQVGVVAGAVDVVAAEAGDAARVHQALREIIALHPVLVRRAVREMRERRVTEFVFLELPEVLEIERSEEHTSELQSLRHLVCRLLLEKK